MGLIVQVNEEGVQLLNSMADGVETASDDITEYAESIIDEIDKYSALGPHKSSIINMVDAIKESTKGSTAPSRVVAEKLRAKAKQYQEFIDEDIFGSGN